MCQANPCYFNHPEREANAFFPTNFQQAPQQQMPM
jgi:hypothetical protein